MEMLGEILGDSGPMAGLAAKGGEGIRAVRLLGAAASLRETRGIPLAPAARAAYRRDVERTRETLPEPAFSSAWAEGVTMTVEKAVDEALRFAQALAPEAGPRPRSSQ